MEKKYYQPEIETMPAEQMRALQSDTIFSPRTEKENLHILVTEMRWSYMNIKTMAELVPGEAGIVTENAGGRLYDLGIIEGTKIVCLLKSPFGDPVAYAIRGAVFAFRNSDAQNIHIQVCPEVESWG